LQYDGEIVRQSERLEIYKKHVKILLDQKIAFEKDGAVWVKIPEDKTIGWTDLVGNKKITFQGKDVDEFVILKSDGFPTYHLANVVDDHLMEITHVLRGEEWTSSTPKHLYLYESFGWEAPEFVHLPVILGTDKTKLSKRHGAESALDYKEKGFLKEALLNYMALLGWNPGGDKEQMSMEEMVGLFKLEDINTANPIFDLTKLEWLNGVWIRTLNEEKRLKENLEDFYKNDSEISKKLKAENACDLVNAASSRMKSLANFQNLISTEKQREMTIEEKETAVKLHNFLIKELGEDNWENEKLLEKLRDFSKSENVPFKTIYFLLSGKEKGIGLLELNQLYGKEFLLENLK
jgi:nondiscriminating glutamyl-tRNA synthetase